MIRAQGNQREADYLFDCGYFEFYWRKVGWKKYCERVKEESKQKT